MGCCQHVITLCILCRSEISHESVQRCKRRRWSVEENEEGKYLASFERKNCETKKKKDHKEKVRSRLQRTKAAFESGGEFFYPISEIEARKGRQVDLGQPKY
ncbi:hypothetical protein EVAR_57203_1 [Eumeta japonica]|uniref:Uncharacterized protein n=1 Tax=Eumeta variegata TaxID=151549 RepID=A0A4C1Z0L3_EUMVA|nr:hypothetical protein EVAR_57203_1 [Eumeta japonica]